MRRIVLLSHAMRDMRRIVLSYHGRKVGSLPWYTLPTHHATLDTPCTYPSSCSTVMQQHAPRCTEDELPGSERKKPVGGRLLLSFWSFILLPLVGDGAQSYSVFLRRKDRRLDARRAFPTVLH